MATYTRLPTLLAGISHQNATTVLRDEIIPYLIDCWLEDYWPTAHEPDVVETTVDAFSYLFDIAPGRLIAAWGISRGKHTGARDKGRMAGHPRSGGARYHRGHAIPHTLGGPTDINLVPQLGKVNVGPFRQLENRAVATPGALYFTHWIYLRPEDQTPTAVEQGLLVPGRPADIRRHAN